MHARQSLPWIALSATVIVFNFGSARAEGIPEPSLVMYGAIRNVSAAGTVRVTTGTLKWVFMPSSGGNAITIETALTNINDQFSYLLRVPCETPIPGATVSPSALTLTETPTRYNRAQVSVNGAAATFVEANLADLVLTGTDRGRLERVDLQLSVAAADSDGNGLADDWERVHFNTIGISPAADPDRDGMSNLAEFKAGTDPNDAKSRFAFIEVQADSTGGVLIKWSSSPGKAYRIERSTDLLRGFTVLASGIASTAAVTSYRDSTAFGAGPYFYRLQLQE